MQNNFEKDVQQKMDGLSLKPSAQVWEKVEMEIAVEKKRRRGIIWFFFAGLLLLSGGWWLSQAFTKVPRQATEAKTAQPDVPQRETLKTVTAGKKPKPVIDGRETVSVKVNKRTITGSKPQGKKKMRTASSLVAKLQKPFHLELSKAPLSSTPAKKTSENPVVESTKRSPPLPRSFSEQPSTMTKPVDTSTVKSVARPDKIDSTSNKNEGKEIVPPAIDSVVKKKVASAKAWRRQLILTTGRSRYADGSLFSSYGGARLEALNFSSGGGVTTPVVAANPSKISGGLAFSLGFSLAKNLGRRWELSFGIGYAYASTHQKVGDKKTADTAVQFSADKALADGFYTNAGTSDYTNRFHFVEVPLNLSFRPSSRLPFYLSAGASYARLLHTNALTFSRASNLYYQNKENYPRNAVSLFSSVQMEFFSKKKTSLRAGPFVHYSLTKLRKENSDGIPRLAVIGFKTAVIF